MSVSSTTDRIGERIEALRKKARLSGNAFAKQAGISQAYLWEIENGQTEPSISSLEKIAKALGVSLKALIPND
jgi:transcriptional regulator with XRE-family HTH domain